MSSINLKELERKAYLSFFEDGLIDLLLGLWLVGIGWLMWSDNGALIGVLAALAVPLLAILKRFITIPRIGVVRLKPSQQRQAAWHKMVWVGVIVLILVLNLVLFGSGGQPEGGMRDFLQQNVDLFFGLLIALPLFIAALITGVWRWLAYTAVLLVTFTVGQWLRIGAPTSALISGGLITISGLLVLIRFVRHYPLVNGEQ